MSPRESIFGLVKILPLGGGGLGAPPNLRGGGVVKRGSKGHKLTPSVQMSTLVGLTKFFNIPEHIHLSRVP